jgi:signal transduction histidine kinase
MTREPTCGGRIAPPQRLAFCAMDAALSLARIPRRRPPASDVLVAGAILVWAVVEALVATGPGTRPARVGMAVLIAVPLLARRRAALPTLVVMCAVMLVWALTAHRPEQGTMPFPALLVALFSVAAYARTPAAAVAGLVVALPAILVTIHSAYYDAEPTAGNMAAITFFSTGTWATGWLVRRRAEHARLAYAESGEVARSAVAEERARIARDLHDVVAHSVSIIAVQAGAAEQLIDQDPAAARDHLAAVRRTARETMGEMRRLLDVLREDEAAYDPQPGLSRLPDLLDEVRGAGVAIECDNNGDPYELPAGVDLVAFRVIQEALTNVRKHAAGATAHVTLTYRAREVAVEVRNTPGTPDPHADGAGHGLIGMRERVRIFGGELETGRTPDGGFRVYAVLPLEEAGR